MVESRDAPDDSISVKVQVSGQALSYLENCDEAEFHLLRGEIILLSTATEIDDRDVIAIPRLPNIFRLYRGSRYHITFYMNDPETMLVLNIQSLLA